MSERMWRSLLVGAVAVLAASFSGAQATRTWVSGVGDDANPCSRTAPCKTFAGAISKTAPGGEIDALDPGGFGAVTITKAITLDGGGGQVASILVAGTNGVVVNAGANDVVTIRNLRFDGVNRQGLNGIRFIAGKTLHVEHCALFGFGQSAGQAAIDFEPTASAQLFVSDTELTNNLTGVFLKRGTGSGMVAAAIERSCIADNGTGVDAEDFSRLTLADSFVAGNASAGILATTSAGTAEVNLERCIVANNGVGVQANTGQTVRLSETMVTGNTTGLQATGSVVSFGNNQVAGNTTDGTPTSVVSLQ
jgi:Right handed beta helix region